jgi:F0F1-type ATP synthase membrane subunit c/vacuolar-type H+-ATPase subunit K
MLVVLSIGCGITIGGGIIGCGGGGSGNTGGGSSQAANATPPGAYSIQVTTSAGSATDTSPVTVSLTVTQ